MKIIGVRSLGVRQVFSPEMESQQHNYITDQSSAVHRNSHALSYCLVAFRCLWLKAHFAPEFWAAVMSGCHPDKLIRYMGVARSEEWIPTDITNSGIKAQNHNVKRVQFATLNINNLAADFTVTGNTVNTGLTGVKNVKGKAAIQFAGVGNYNSIDEFVADPSRAKKIVLERFIKLGAFSHLKNHENMKAVWNWFQYKYMKNNSKLKKEIQEKLRAKAGHTKKLIEDYRSDLIDKYKLTYPKRKKIPAKILNALPPVDDSFESVVALFDGDDFTFEEKLEFQQKYLGYWIDSPLDAFKCTGTKTINNAKEVAMRGDKAVIEGIISTVTSATTKTNKPYLKIILNDGVQSCLIFVWYNELAYQDLDLIKDGAGVSIPVDYDDKRGTFALSRGKNITVLSRK